MIWNQRIKELREKTNLTLLDISKRLGVSEATAQRYESERGIKNIPYEQIIGYSQIFNVTPAYIMGWDEDPAAGSTPKQNDVKLSDRAVQIGMAYDRADDRSKVAVEVALGINFTSESAGAASSGSRRTA